MKEGQFHSDEDKETNKHLLKVTYIQLEVKMNFQSYLVWMWNDWITHTRTHISMHCRNVFIIELYSNVLYSV